MIEIHKDNDTKYRFSLKAKSGHTLLNSIDFTDKSHMDQAIETLGSLTITRNHFERKTNHEGRFLFNLKDSEGRLIGTSQLYDSEAGMENGIKNLQNRLASLNQAKEL